VFGISAGEFVVLMAVAAVVLGPERLPDYARQLARLIRGLRTMAQGATTKVREEMGPEFDEIDWRKLDPRQYDPRRIVREALSDAFDPDDPLGLKEFDKPVSAGGPAQATANAQRASTERAAAERAAAERAAAQAAAVASHEGLAESGASPTSGSNRQAAASTAQAAASTVSFDPDAT
jgi:sec-independent protein translocase protein TatB